MVTVDPFNSDHQLTPPQDQHMRLSLLRQLPQCLTAIALTAIIDQPPQDQHMRDHC